MEGLDRYLDFRSNEIRNSLIYWLRGVLKTKFIILKIQIDSTQRFKG